MDTNDDQLKSNVIVGKKVACFYITCFVRQGCPLASFLFLLYGEMLAMGLQATKMQSQGLKIPDYKADL